jgi:hypothetical protein
MSRRLLGCFVPVHTAIHVSGVVRVKLEKKVRRPKEGIAAMRSKLVVIVDATPRVKRWS